MVHRHGRFAAKYLLLLASGQVAGRWGAHGLLLWQDQDLALGHRLVHHHDGLPLLSITKRVFWLISTVTERGYSDCNLSDSKAARPAHQQALFACTSFSPSAAFNYCRKSDDDLRQQRRRSFAFPKRIYPLTSFRSVQALKLRESFVWAGFRKRRWTHSVRRPLCLWPSLLAIAENVFCQLPKMESTFQQRKHTYGSPLECQQALGEVVVVGARPFSAMSPVSKQDPETLAQETQAGHNTWPLS